MKMSEHIKLDVRSVRFNVDRWHVLGKDGHLICKCYSEHEALAIVHAINGHDPAIDGLRRTERFINNGIEMGYISVPDSDDPATETLPTIAAILKNEEK